MAYWFEQRPGLWRLGALVLFTVGMSACVVVPADVTPQNVAVGLRALEASLVMAAGSERDLLPFIREQATGQIPIAGLVWSVSNPGLLHVDPATGRAKALAKGDVVVTASQGAQPGAPSAQIVISVIEADAILVKEVTIAPETKRLRLGESVIFQGSVRLADGQVNANVNWASSDSTVAAINPTTGEARALRTGQVTIVASYAADPRYKALAELIITESVAETAPPPAPSPSRLRSEAPVRQEAPPPPAPAPTPSANRPSPSLSQAPLVVPAAADTVASAPVSPSPVASRVPTPQPTRSYGLGGYAVIHPDDGHVCGVYVGNGHWHNTRPPMSVYDCPSGSLHYFQTRPSETGNVAGWHGPNVIFKDGVFTIFGEDGKVMLTVIDGIATDQNGRSFDTGTGKTVGEEPPLPVPTASAASATI